MTIETAIKTRTDAAGTTAGSRNYAVTSPQNPQKPYTVFQRISSNRDSLLSDDSGVAKGRFQFNAYADTYEEAVALAEEIRATWQRFAGTEASVEILDCEFENDIDGYDDDVESYVKTIDLLITYRE